MKCGAAGPNPVVARCLTTGCIASDSAGFKAGGGLINLHHFGKGAFAGGGNFY